MVKESRKKAEDATLLIPEIEENIQNAESSTYSALTALRDADSYASAAEKLALAAQNKSNSALVVRSIAIYSYLPTVNK